MKNMQFIRSTFFASTIVLLQACGGSSDASTESNPDDFTPVVSQTGIIAFDDTIKTSQAVDLFLYYPDDELSNINWQQTAGTNVVFHASNAKGIAFTPNAAGDYSFQVSFTRNGVNEQLTHTVSVNSDISQVSARLGHAVLEGTDVSLRVSLANSTITQDSIQWQQISGPAVTYSDTTQGETAVFFTAPTG